MASKSSKTFRLDRKMKNKDRYEVERAEIAELEERLTQEVDVSSVHTFMDVPLSRWTLAGLESRKFTEPTEIQRQSLPFALRGLDILGAAKTGSGKTLAFVIPILERLYRSECINLDGLVALVITPVRELAYQIFAVLRGVGQKHDFSAGLIIGGREVKHERDRLDHCNIIVCTPGRLLQHMDENPLFDTTNLKILVLDEADRILDMGFAKDINAILENLPKTRQTMLFSATQTKSVKDLARLSLRDPVYVSVHENAKHSTPEALKQSYIVCELHEKMSVLWSFIKHHLKQKVLVFMTSCKQVRFVYQLFRQLRPGMVVMALFGTMQQIKRLSIYEEFCQRRGGALLLATDIAARGLDFPSVDWVVQADCPSDANEYIHRAGRTARNESSGEALLILLPSEEEAILEQFRESRIPIERIRVNPKKQLSILRKAAALLAKDVSLKQNAQAAFVSYLKSIFLMKNKAVFDVSKLDTDAYAMSLGLAYPPRIRFLQKKGILPPAKMIPKEDEERRLLDSAAKSMQKPFGFSSKDNQSDEEETFLSVKSRTQDHIEEPLDPLDTIRVSRKRLTKVAVAKKILKKNPTPNVKVAFDDDGQIVRDRTGNMQMSETAQKLEDEVAGFDFATAMELMKDEDIIDKKVYSEKIRAKHREERLKKKMLKRERSQGMDTDMEVQLGGADSESVCSSVDLDFLPDPDEIYGKQDSAEEKDETDSSRDESIDKNEIQKKQKTIKRKKKAIKKKNSVKKARPAKLVDDGDRPLNTGLSLMEDEELAMHLLLAAK